MRYSGRIGVAAVAAGMVLTACLQGAPRATGVATTAATPSAAPVLPAPSSSPPAAGQPAIAWAVPPVGVKTPMAGEPTSSVLASTRLVSESCESNQKAVEAVVQSRVDRMRREVEQSLRGLEDRAFVRARDAVGARVRRLVRRRWPRPERSRRGRRRPRGRDQPRLDRDHRARRRACGERVGHQQPGAGRGRGRHRQERRRVRLRRLERRAAHRRGAASAAALGHAACRATCEELLVHGDRAVAFVASGGRPAAARAPTAYDCSVGGDGTDHEPPRARRRRPRAPPHRAADRSRRGRSSRRAASATPSTPWSPTATLPSAGYETWPVQIPTSARSRAWTPPRCTRASRQLERENEKKIRAASPGFPTITEQGMTRALCAAMHVALGDGTAFTTLVSFDMRDDRTPADHAPSCRAGRASCSRPSRRSTSRCSTREAASAAGTRSAPRKDEVSEIHKFRIGDSPAETRYVGQRRRTRPRAQPVRDGRVVRLPPRRDHARPRARSRAPTAPYPSSPRPTAGSLVRIGAVDHIAPDEDIRAVRFDGDRGYIVTFKKTDPLFVIDLGQPVAPRDPRRAEDPRLLDVPAPHRSDSPHVDRLRRRRPRQLRLLQRHHLADLRRLAARPSPCCCTRRRSARAARAPRPRPITSRSTTSPSGTCWPSP